MGNGWRCLYYPSWSGFVCALIALVGFCLPFGRLEEESFSLYQFFLRNGNTWFSWAMMACFAIAAAYCLLGAPIGAAALEAIPIYSYYRVMGAYASALGQAWALSSLDVGAWLHGAGLLGVCASLFLRRLDRYLTRRLLSSVWDVRGDAL